MGLAEDLLDDARYLARKRTGRDARRQEVEEHPLSRVARPVRARVPPKGIAESRASCMRRAVSIAYYAVFHLLVEDFVGNWPFPNQRGRLARMFDHRKMRDAAFRRIATEPITTFRGTSSGPMPRTR